jgi:PAS domain S-box-containing protein
MEQPTERLASANRALAWRAAPTLAWVVLLVAVGYYLGALIGFRLRFPSSGISFFWPPTAVLTAALLLASPRGWGALLTGAFVAHAIAHAQNGLPVQTWTVQFLANALQSVVTAYLVRRYSDPHRPFRDLQRAGAFIVCACVIGPSVASLVVAFVYVTQGWAASFVNAWTARTVSNAIAALTLVPPIVMGLPYLWSRPPLPPARRVVELGLILSGLLLAHSLVQDIGRRDSLALSLALYAPAPFLLWATVRFGGLGLSGTVLIATLLTISSALRGEGAFGSESPLEAVVGVQLFVAITTVPLILIAGLLEQNRREHGALVEMERQNSAILRAMPDLLFVQTRDGTYVQHYARDRSDLLVPPQAFLGKNMRDVLPPDLAAKFADAFTTVTSGEPSVVEYELIVGGALHQYEARFTALGGDRVLSIVRDITARRRSEEALREARQRYGLATAAGGIGVWDVNLGTGEATVEGGLEKLLGYDEGEIGQTLGAWMRLISREDVDEAYTRLMAYATGANPQLEAEYRMVCKDGSVKWILFKGALVDRVEGKATRVTGTYADMTLRRQTEDALKHANDALVRMGRVSALSELSASIAHELNQPLAAIASNANACLRWLAADAPDADFGGALRDVVSDSFRASGIVQRTREMFANRSVQKTTVDVKSVIRDVVDLTGTRLQKSAVRLDVDLDEQVPIVEADVIQIKQVVLNLVLNAIDSLLDVHDRPRILRIASKGRDGGVLVTVWDNGPGFRSPDLDRLFEPFYTTKADGVGIGLAISRSIVDAHSGAMWAETNPSGGATFSFTLPAYADVPDAKVV